MTMSHQHRADWNRRKVAALAVLTDPIKFADEMWERTFGNDRVGFDTLFMADAPADLWANRDEAMKLIRLAAATPGSDLEGAFGLAGDILNNLVCGVGHKGIFQGVVLESLRRGMLEVYLDLQKPEDHRAHDQESLATLRAEIEAKRSAFMAEAA